MSVTINITDNATPLLQRLQSRVRAGSLEKVMGQAATNTIKDYLFGLDATRPNKLGGRRTNFYAGAAKATTFTSMPGYILIGVNQLGMRQRLEGGEINPVNAKYLTIPADPEAYGKRASEFSNLKFTFAVNKFGAMQPALVEAAATRVGFGGRQKNGQRTVNRGSAVGGKVMFWLCRQANQKGDPSVMPSGRDIVESAIKAGSKYVESLDDRRGGNV